jgi:hypothetical protein
MCFFEVRREPRCAGCYPSGLPDSIQQDVREHVAQSARSVQGMGLPELVAADIRNGGSGLAWP